MRALLVLGVLWLWLACLLAAVALPVLLVLELRRRRRAPDAPVGAPGPPANRTLVVLLGGFAVVMVACAAVLGGAIAADGGGPAVDLGEVTPWVALPLWSASMAVALAVVLARGRREAPR